MAASSQLQKCVRKTTCSVEGICTESTFSDFVNSQCSRWRRWVWDDTERPEILSQEAVQMDLVSPGETTVEIWRQYIWHSEMDSF